MRLPMMLSTDKLRQCRGWLVLPPALRVAQLSASLSLLSAGLQARWPLTWLPSRWLFTPKALASLYERKSSSRAAASADLMLYPSGGGSIGRARGSWFWSENPMRKSLRDRRCPAPRGGRPDADAPCCSEPSDGGDEGGSAAPAAGSAEYGSGASASVEKNGVLVSDRARCDPPGAAGGASAAGGPW